MTVPFLTRVVVMGPPRTAELLEPLRGGGVALVGLVPAVVVRVLRPPDLRVADHALASQAAEVLEPAPAAGGVLLEARAHALHEQLDDGCPHRVGKHGRAAALDDAAAEEQAVP